MLHPLRYVLVWALAGFAYAVFWFWYAAPQAPLTPNEITQHISRYAALYADGRASEFQVRLRGFLAGDDGREIFMQHLVRMRADPLPVQGLRVRQMSSFDVIDYWYDRIFWRLYRQASYPFFIAPAISLNLSAWGVAHSTSWTHSILIRHRSRRDLMRFVNDSDFAKRQLLLPAAIESHFAFAVAPANQFLMLKPEIVMAWIIFALAALTHIIALLQDKNYRRSHSKR